MHYERFEQTKCVCYNQTLPDLCVLEFPKAPNLVPYFFMQLSTMPLLVAHPYNQSMLTTLHSSKIIVPVRWATYNVILISFWNGLLQSAQTCFPLVTFVFSLFVCFYFYIFCSHNPFYNTEVELQVPCVSLRGRINLNFSTTYAVDCGAYDQ